MFSLPLAIGVGAILGLPTIASIILRRVVPSNMVTIVQSAKNTKSFGTGQEAGNVYWDIPSWVPLFGITTVSLPVSNFALNIDNYVAYDKDRVPFMVDITAFFRIADTNTAAKRVSHFEELQEQLLVIIQGSVRKILANDVIDTIMLQRSKFGEAFTKEVGEQLKNWGVETVKNIELMDIRDAQNSKVIANIMAKKQSFIEMESRKEVAENNKVAEMAEIDAQREVELQQQMALQAVGERTAEKDKAVGIAQEKSAQEVAVQQKTTKEKQMEVVKVEEVKKAEINKEKQRVVSEQDKQTAVIKAEADKETAITKAQGDKEAAVTKAEGEKQATILSAEATLEEEKRKAEATKVNGEAVATAEKQKQMAVVEPQITLAKEIGENGSYQTYLIKIEEIKANQAVGMEQAKALSNADLKVIANTGNPAEGVSSLGKLFSPQGGTALAGMLEAVSNTPQGKALLETAGVKAPSSKAPKATKLPDTTSNN